MALLRGYEAEDAIIQAFSSAFQAYMGRMWNERAYLPPPQSIEVSIDEYRYLVNVRLLLPGEECIDLKFSCSAGFEARHFTNMRGGVLYNLWADAYGDMANSDALHALNGMRYAAALFGPSQGTPDASVTATSILNDIQRLDMSGLISRLCRAARAFHDERRRAQTWSWRPERDTFTRSYATPEQLMHALLIFEGDRNPVMQTVRHIVRGVRQLTFVDQLPNQGRDTIRAQFDAVFPNPDLEQLCALERAMGEPSDSRAAFRNQYEHRWDSQDARAALDQRAVASLDVQLSARRAQQMAAQLTEQMERQTLAALMGGVAPTPAYPSPGLDLATFQQQVMLDAARYGMGAMRVGLDLASGPDLSIYRAGDYRVGDYSARVNAAEAKAEKLLRENLSPAQLRQLDVHGCFDVVGGHSGKTYRITRGRQMNVYQLDKNGRRVRGLCFVPEGKLASGDVMLTQKLSLELQEKAALAVANVF